MNRKNKLGTHTVRFPSLPGIASWAAVAGKKESAGPLGKYFDETYPDTTLSQKTWEQAESAMQSRALGIALEKAKLDQKSLDRIYAGDLLNQCISSSFAHKATGIPYLGLYGACSTMAQGLGLGAMTVDGGYGENIAVITSSHFCSAERQYRMPLEYGGQRPPSAQWTCTASGCAILTPKSDGPYICSATCGHIVDAGVTDANNMGAAMAPAAFDTLTALFTDTSTSPDSFDLILTGDLGALGSKILRDLCAQKGIALGENYFDCGELIFSPSQDTHCGGSGCGCSAAVLCGKILDEVRAGRYKRVIFAGTGALHSPTEIQQGSSIPGICHAVVICGERECAL